MMFTSGSLVLFGLAVPRVLGQTLDWAAVTPLPPYSPSIDSMATAQTVSYNPTAAAASVAAQISNGAQPSKRAQPALQKRQSACAPLPSGSGPSVSPDTVAAFEAYQPFAQAALNAVTPAGYTNTFTNLNCSSNAWGYMGFQDISSYDVSGCATLCDNTAGCLAFNIYFERDPTESPADACPNPPSTTNIKCVLWGGPVNAQNANNCGQWQNQFEVVIAGSNGYVNNTVQTFPGWNPPQSLGNCAINAPQICNGTYDTYMGNKIFTGTPFDASLCEAACEATSAYDLAHPSPGQMPQTCQFFNTFLLLENGVPVGQYCAMYTQAWDSSYATNCGQWQGSNEYTIMDSYTYTNSTTPSESVSCSVSSSTTSSTSSTSWPSSKTSSSTTCKTSSTSKSSSSTTCKTSTTSTTSCTTLTTKTSSTSTSSTCTAAASATPCSKPPTNSNCNVQGWNPWTPVISQASGPHSCPSQNICAWNCLQHNDCGSFAWEESSQSCVLLQGQTGSPQWWWSWFWSWNLNDVGCWKYDCSQGGAPYPKPPSTSGLPFMSQCSKDSDCQCGRCLNFNAPHGVCL